MASRASAYEVGGESTDVYRTVSSSRSGGDVYYINIPVRPLLKPIALDNLHRMSLYNTLAGIVLLAVGVVAIVFPLFFAFALEQVIGWLLVIMGVYSVFTFVMVLGAPGTISFLLLGLLHLSVGLWLVLSPRLGLLALAIIMAGWLIIHGVFKVVLACTIRAIALWFFPLLSGLVSLALGIFTISFFPANRSWLLGILVGADIAVTGTSLLIVGAMAEFGKRVGDEAQQLLAGHSRDVESLPPA